MLELFECPPTRSQRARWVREELGIDYTRRRFELPAREQDSDAYRTIHLIHPLGVVPALRTNDYPNFGSTRPRLKLRQL